MLDLYLAVKLPGGWSLEARLDNASDHEYETFGLYGEPDEVMLELDDDAAVLWARHAEDVVDYAGLPVVRLERIWRG